jgi:hypothetical protein
MKSGIDKACSLAQFYFTVLSPDQRGFIAD